MALLEPLAAKMAEEQFKLVIMDSITALFRSDFTGRGELAERQQRLGQLMHRLRKLADEFNVVSAVSLHSNHSIRRLRPAILVLALLVNPNHHPPDHPPHPPPAPTRRSSTPTRSSPTPRAARCSSPTRRRPRAGT